jgi:uncharacterized protein (TIGR02145 family)
MQDGRIWMVQDLKFGDKCDKTTFAGSTSDQAGSKLTSIAGYIYGECRNNSQPNAGYMYDWAGAIQKAGAYNGSNVTNFQCTGVAAGTGSPNPGACQGIGPAGWHIPTGNTAGVFYDVQNNYNRGCVTNNDDCWDANSTWEGVLGGFCNSNGSFGNHGSYGYYWSSTYLTTSTAYVLRFNSSGTVPGTHYGDKPNGALLRCVRNY